MVEKEMRTCPGCTGHFMCRPKAKQVYCSKECRWKNGVASHGERWAATDCPRCQKPNMTKNKYCSKACVKNPPRCVDCGVVKGRGRDRKRCVKCYGISRRGRPGGVYFVRTCGVCGVKYKKQKSLKYKNHYCSNACRGVAKSERAKRERQLLPETQKVLFRAIECIDCKVVFFSKAIRKRCSTCKREREKQHSRKKLAKYQASEAYQEYLAAKRMPVTITCKWCRKDTAFDRGGSRIKFCSHKCSRKSASWNRKQLERATSGGVVLSRREIFNRDDWKCQLCGITVIRVNNRGAYRPDGATVDHIIPLSRGGTHTMDNVQAACWACNTSKGDTMPEVYGSIRAPVRM